MVELSDSQQKETEGKLQFHFRLMLMKHIFTSLEVLNLKILDRGLTEPALSMNLPRHFV